MFIDAHAHIYQNDVEAVLARAKDALVDFVICPASDFDSINQTLKIANSSDMVYACIGFHPQDAQQFEEGGEQFLIEHAKNKKVVAIGEIGLDYHFGGEDRALQKRVFEKQIQIASELDLPIVVHIRDAMDDALEILQKNAKFIKGGVVHCFSGESQDAQKIMQLGLDFTIGGVLTFKNGGRLREVVKNIPLERIMLETDSPYLAPEPLRGSVNEPKNVVLVAQKLAEIKGENIENIAKITSKNVKRVFKI